MNNFYTGYNQHPSCQLIYPMMPMDNSNQYMSYLPPPPPPLHLYHPPAPYIYNNNVNAHKVPVAPIKKASGSKRKRASQVDPSSLSPLSVSSYSSALSFPEDDAGQKRKSPATNERSKTIASESKNNVSTTEDPESAEDEEESHNKSLERNRLAASKCRQRKKEWVDELAHKAERMARENEHLRQLLLQLKEETLFLKTQLIMHKENDYETCKKKAFLSIF